jgi:hypothetical protein
MLPPMIRSLLLALLLAAASGHAAEGPWVLDAEFWASPRSGETVRDHPVLREAVDALLRDPGSRLVIRYPGGETGQLWVQELRAWLVALAIPSDRIDILLGGSGGDQLLLSVQP